MTKASNRLVFGRTWKATTALAVTRRSVKKTANAVRHLRTEFFIRDSPRKVRGNLP
jgi:hypothetical protein